MWPLCAQQLENTLPCLLIVSRKDLKYRYLHTVVVPTVPALEEFHCIDLTLYPHSLIPRPRPAFRCLPYCKRRKAGRGLGTRLVPTCIESNISPIVSYPDKISHCICIHRSVQVHKTRIFPIASCLHLSMKLKVYYLFWLLANLFPGLAAFQSVITCLAVCKYGGKRSSENLVMFGY